MIRVLLAGDVVGRAGREAVEKYLPSLKEQLKIDLTIINVDNAAGGSGATPKICRDFLDNGIDLLTGGDHIWDSKDIASYLDREHRLLRPHNFPPITIPGVGFQWIEKKSKQILVIHIQGQVFMKHQLENPFVSVDQLIKRYPLGQKADAIIVDFHAEATSEKMAMGHFLDGKVSALIGTHTHVPTSDTMILEHGTAYQTDAGMCGDFDSVIGREKHIPVHQFYHRTVRQHHKVASKEATFCATLIDIDPDSGLALDISQIQLGGKLAQMKPSGYDTSNID